MAGASAQPRIWRRLFHVFAGSSIPVAGILAPEQEFLIALAVVAAGALLLDFSRFGFGPLNRVYMRWMSPLLKSDEDSHITGATYMLIAAVPVFWVFGKDVGVPVMFFLSLGDPAAAMVGRRMPGPRLFGKSPVGTAAFAATGAAVAALLVGTGAIGTSLGAVARRGHRGAGGTGRPPARRQPDHPPHRRGGNVGYGGLTLALFE